MEKWFHNGYMKKLVEERKQGILDRRSFLKILGGFTLGAAGLPLIPTQARGQKKITVTMWDTEPNPITRKVMKEMVADFQRLHPDIEILSEGMGWGDMDRKIQAGLAAGTPPTASHGQTYIVTTFQAKGIIDPLDDLIKSIGKDRIFPSVLKWLEYKGHFYGLTHAWGTDLLSGRGDYAKEAGVNPFAWKTWDDWLKDMPKLNKPPKYYAMALSGIPFFINEDVYMWTGSNGGSLFDKDGNPILDSPQVIGMLEFWKKLKPYLPPGWSSHDYLETLSALATGRVAQTYIWGRTAGYIDQYAPADQRNPEVFQIWPKTRGPMGKEALTQFDNEPWMIYSAAPKAEKEAAKEFLKFFYKKENYRKYCDSVPVHLNSIFKEDFKDPDYMGHPERKRWRPWLDAQVDFVARERAYPLLICEPRDRMIPWLGDVAGSPILADMVMAVVEKGEDPKKAAKEANLRITRDIIEKWKKS